ncbi:MAG TPA: phosphatase PAP2/dual specificity phosphatase family protein [Chthoniobacterales bacterium]|nr:phosphatase PAP2/dual specificity phosphatase family protein [Chthoniobacterales bacterium]
MARANQIERRSARSTQLIVSAGLSALFLIVYGWCNWFTAHRPHVPTLFFEWERSIPFVPLMIVPYMSIDLFFVGAPFLCRTDRELAAFSKRIVAAILVAGICFLLFPLRFAFERPHADGWLGAFFDWFRGMDRPFNLLPSLHIALRTILAELYARHTRGFLRHASNIWFVLIGLSAVLTYQHHVMDVVAGFALGAYCLYFFPERQSTSDAFDADRAPSPQLRSKNLRVGTYYLAGAGAVSVLMVIWWLWGAFLLWPAISLGLVAAAYFGLGPAIFRKRDGRLPWPTWWTLAPVLFGLHLSRLYYRRQCRHWDEVTPSVWVGGVLSEREAAEVVRRGVTSVLDLTAEFSEARPFLRCDYRNIAVLDLTAPRTRQLEEIVDFIEDKSRNGIVYVHCKIGYSRSAAAAAAWLLKNGKARSVSDAIEVVRKARPCVVVRPEVIAALERFASAEIPNVSPRLGETLLQ